MSGYDVPAEAPVCRHGPFQVYLAADLQGGQAGTVQRFVHHVGAEAVAVYLGGCQAYAVDSHTVPYLQVVQNGFGLQMQNGGMGSFFDLFYGAYFFYDSCERNCSPLFFLIFLNLFKGIPYDSHIIFQQQILPQRGNGTVFQRDSFIGGGEAFSFYGRFGVFAAQ